MKIILDITNSTRKSLVFVSNELHTHPLEKAVHLTRDKKIKYAHVVQRGKTTYIRTSPKVPKSEEFDTLSITSKNILLYAHGTRLTKISPALNAFVELCGR